MRPIPTAATFAQIREAYFAAKAGSPPDPHDATVRAALEKSPSGAKVVVAGGVPLLEIRPSPFGRGLFVTQAVKEGRPVYEATRYGIFRTASQWRRFLELLPSRDLVYDIVLWSYVLDWDEGVQVVAVDLDEGSLMNHGGEEPPAAEASATHGVNVLSQESGRSANVRYCDDTCHYVATRDIAADEEILCDYTSFHVSSHSLEWYDQTWDEIVGNEGDTIEGVDT